MGNYCYNLKLIVFAMFASVVFSGCTDLDDNQKVARLQDVGLGNFTGAKYWSSTETDAGNSQTVNFVNGNVSATSKIPAVNSVRTRAVRYF